MNVVVRGVSGSPHRRFCLKTVLPQLGGPGKVTATERVEGFKLTVLAAGPQAVRRVLARQKIAFLFRTTHLVLGAQT